MQRESAAGTFFAVSMVGGAAVFTHIVKLLYVVLVVHGILPLLRNFRVVLCQLVAHFASYTSRCSILVDRSAVSANFHFNWSLMVPG